jgi:hypothetical protein
VHADSPFRWLGAVIDAAAAHSPATSAWVTPHLMTAPRPVSFFFCKALCPFAFCPVVAPSSQSRGHFPC